MYRIQDTVDYHSGEYHGAVEAFGHYLKNNAEPTARRDALYVLGVPYCRTGVYSQVPVVLGEVITGKDELAQNAYLHMGLAYLQLADKNKACTAFKQAAASNANLKIKEQASYSHALHIHETSCSAFGEFVTVFENFLNEFFNPTYVNRVSNYLVEVYMNTRSYDAALEPTEHITHPNGAILEAKQKISFHLGAQHFTNMQFERATLYFNQNVTLGQYNLQTKTGALYRRGESYHRLNHMRGVVHSFNDYLSFTTQRNTEMCALAYCNLAHIAFHKKDYATARDRFRKFIQL